MKKLFTLFALLFPLVLLSQNPTVSSIETTTITPLVPGIEPESSGSCLSTDTLTQYLDRGTQFFVLNAGASGFVFGTGSITSQTAVHYDAPVGLARIDGALIFFTQKVVMGGVADSLPIYVYTAATDSMPQTLIGQARVSVADIDTSGPATYVPIPNCQTFTGQFLIAVDHGAINDTVNIISNNVLTTMGGPDGNQEKRVRQFRNNTWQRTWDIWNLAGAPLDADAIVMPIVCLIQCQGPPNAMYTSNATGLGVQFTDGSTGDQPAQWSWDFGDGNSSNMQDPFHAYAAPGTYTVCLIATNACGPDTTCQQVTVTCNGPAAQFGVLDNGLGNVDFTDLSGSGSTITNWLWDFGDGFTSTMQNPNHQYPGPGTYLVCLTVTDVCGTDSTCTSITLANCPPPVAGFSVTDNGAGNYDFTDASTTGGATTYVWDFGDGNTGSSMNENHTYAGNGTYTVCLTVTDSCNTDSSCQTVTVTSVNVESGLLSDLSVAPNPNNGHFVVSGQLLTEGALEVSVFSVVGREVFRADVQTTSGRLRKEIAMDGLAPGVYYLSLRQGKERLVRKLLVE
ncbi:MAG: PKD domain-containing protein [Bacteroidota bacterium]